MPIKRSIIPLHIQYGYIYTWRNSPYFSPPHWLPFAPPLCPLLLTVGRKKKAPPVKKSPIFKILFHRDNIHSLMQKTT